MVVYDACLLTASGAGFTKDALRFDPSVLALFVQDPATQSDQNLNRNIIRRLHKKSGPYPLPQCEKNQKPQMNI